ncbi:actin-like protein ALP4 [Besnoitia besnoiti]|uniref:Actin-like protein ALP4 n=1 Tax=Besnoitia besnoiti TaxID=94643 RepID=A0A2A9M7C1_BESBE|nr:actin-like protein ALP4 [Besnoitia besnoiti]PFH33839.1 actin-like protein ALP4 [Besnoitia besnoiti]
MAPLDTNEPPSPSGGSSRRRSSATLLDWSGLPRQRRVSSLSNIAGGAAAAEDFFFYEQLPVVLEFGSAFCKAGLGGEPEPQCIVRTQELRKGPENVKTLKSAFVKRTPIETPAMTRWRLRLKLDELFFRRLMIQPKDRSVVLCEGMMRNPAEKAALVQLLFEVYDVPSIAFVPGLVSPLYCCGVDTGIVVDVGHWETRVLATVLGCPHLHSLTVAGVGAASVDRELRHLLRSAVAGDPVAVTLVDSLSAEQLENIKVTCCYTAYDLREAAQQRRERVQRKRAETGTAEGDAPSDGQEVEDGVEVFKSNKAIKVRVYDNNTLTIDASTRWKACEVLFGAVHGATASVQEAIVECIRKCPFEMRKLIVQNILLCGGTAQFRGFTTRLAIELEAHLAAEPSLEKLRPLVNFGVPCFSPLLRSWTGGSIHAGLPGKQEYTKADYERGLPVPDWTAWIFTASSSAAAAEAATEAGEPAVPYLQPEDSLSAA